jgi:hypothetical protein
MKLASRKKLSHKAAKLEDILAVYPFTWVRTFSVKGFKANRSRKLKLTKRRRVALFKQRREYKSLLRKYGGVRALYFKTTGVRLDRVVLFRYGR